MTYLIIKLCFVGISLADQAGLEKAPRWAKIWSKCFQNQDMLGLLLYSLSVLKKIKNKIKKNCKKEEEKVPL